MLLQWVLGYEGGKAGLDQSKGGGVGIGSENPGVLCQMVPTDFL